MTDKKSILITGASKGIGKTTALYLAERGFRVFAGFRKMQDGEILKEEGKGNIVPIRIDVTKPDMIAEAFTVIGKILGDKGLDGLVNNAGISVAGPLEFLPVEKIRWQMEVNFLGQIAVTQAAMPLIRKAGGRIVNISSVSGRWTSPFLAPYSASKFSMEVFSDALRRELMPWGIKVVVVEPGSIATPIWETSLEQINKTLAELPPEAIELYGEKFEVMRKHVNKTEKYGDPPENVARTIYKALTAKNPKTRYPVGLHIKLAVLAGKLLPDKLLDWFVWMKLKSK
jgi:NAD(P)-dependent dehydrogenase (short-subunit alcohol dehydrogenase family)